MLRGLLNFWLLLLLGIALLLGTWAWWQGEQWQDRLYDGAAQHFEGTVELPKADAAQEPSPGRWWPAVTTFDPVTFQRPPRAYAPWIRWWWPSVAPDRGSLLRGVQALADQGFAGASVQLTGAGLAPSDRPQLHPDRLTLADNALGRSWRLLLGEAHKRGLALNWMPPTGWPTGGAHLHADQGLQSLAFGEIYVRGGKRIQIPLPRPRVPAAYYFSAYLEAEFFPQEPALTWLPDSAQRLTVFAARVRAHQRNPLAIDLEDFIAFYPDSVLRLDSYVDSLGQINWDAPPGYWELVTVYQMPVGQHPLWGLSDQPGWVANALDTSQAVAEVRRHLGSLPADPSASRSAWRSLSVESPAWLAEQAFVPELLDRFQADHGYALVDWLPVLAEPGADNALFGLLRPARQAAYRLGDADARVRHDYAQTRSDWWLDQVQPRERQAAATAGRVLQQRVYGPRLDLIRAAGQADLPTMSQGFAGGSQWYLRQVASGAWLYGRPLVAADALMLPGQAGAMTPEKARQKGLDLLLAGANQIEWLGLPLAGPDSAYGPLGWHPFASPYFSRGAYASDWRPGTLLHRYAEETNRYLARCQYAMQWGRPAVDVLVYYPFLGFPPSWHHGRASAFPGSSGSSSDTVPLPWQGGSWDGWANQGDDPRVEWLAQVAPLLEKLEDLGYTWAWANDHWLQAADLDAGQLSHADQTHRYVLLLDPPQLALPTLERLVELHRQGGRVQVYGNLPDQQPGYANRLARDSSLRELARELVPALPVGTPQELSNVLRAQPPRQPLSYAGEFPFLRHLRRSGNDSSQVLLLRNEEPHDRFFELNVDADLPHLYWLDPSTGQIAPDSASPSGRLQGYLGPQACRLLLALPAGQALPDSVLTPLSGLNRGLMTQPRLDERPLGPWQFIARDRRLPGGVYSLTDTSLFDWRAEAVLRHFRGDALYTHTFQLADTLAGRAYVLELPPFTGVVDLRVNTVPVGQLWHPPYRMDLTPYLLPGANTLEIWLSSPPRNQWVGQARETEAPGYAPYRALPLLPAGLQGPVRLVELDGTRLPL